MKTIVKKSQVSLSTRIVSLIEQLLRCLAKHPISVQPTEYGSSLIISVLPHIEDYGKLVGQGGVMVKAFEDVLARIAEAQTEWTADGTNAQQEQLGIRYRLISPGDKLPRSKAHRDFKAAEKWNSEPFRKLLEDLLMLIYSPENLVVLAEETLDLTILRVSLTVPNESDLDGLAKSLNTIWRAIGKANGRSEMIVMINRA